ncbi:hypothetical protein BC828DRAFT_372328 [Blastocladiella britannica]|nr:hypothetical protein BC828DRAFT_372328 [Blastocladiella britannica]
MSALLPRDWDSLRRLAKQTEADCEARLSAFARAASAAATNQPASTTGSAPTSLTATESQLNDLLRRMGQIVEQMALVMTPASPPSHSLLVQRQRDTLQEHTREFRRIKANLTAAREHSELLSSVRSDINAHRHAQSSGADYFLSERSQLDSTHIMMDDVLEQAHATRSNLDAQHQSLLGAHRRIGGVNQMFPQLNSLMARIRVRRRRDTIILSVVTAVCIFALFLFFS